MIRCAVIRCGRDGLLSGVGRDGCDQVLTLPIVLGILTIIHITHRLVMLHLSRMLWIVQLRMTTAMNKAKVCIPKA